MPRKKKIETELNMDDVSLSIGNLDEDLNDDLDQDTKFENEEIYSGESELLPENYMEMVTINDDKTTEYNGIKESLVDEEVFKVEELDSTKPNELLHESVNSMNISESLTQNREAEVTEKKLSLVPLYKELVKLVKDRGIDNVNTFRDIITSEYPDYDQADVDPVWVSIADYANKVHQLYEKIYQYYRIFVQSIVDNKALNRKEKQQKIKAAVSGSPLASYVMRVAAGEVEALYKELYYELEGDLNRVMKLLG